MSAFAHLLALTMMSDSAATAPAPVKPDPLDKVVCRREVETGSLSRVRKECRTRREWGQIADANRRDVDTMRDRAGPRSTNGSDFTPF
jgi:hypothetical protein